MNYLIYDKETGRVTQSNQVYQHSDKYDGILNGHGLNFTKVEHDGILHIDDYYVARDQVTGRPDLPLFCKRTRFKAGDDDAAMITGLPEGTRVTITATGGIVLANAEPVSGGFVEIPSPIPAEYELLFEKFPYRSRRVRIVAQ